MSSTLTQKQAFVTNPRYAFVKGWKRVPQADMIRVKIEVMQVFNIVSDAAWLRRLKGQVTPNVEQMQAVEAVFKKHGITKIWGL